MAALLARARQSTTDQTGWTVPDIDPIEELQATLFTPRPAEANPSTARRFAATVTCRFRDTDAGRARFIRASSGGNDPSSSTISCSLRWTVGHGSRSRNCSPRLGRGDPRGPRSPMATKGGRIPPDRYRRSGSLRGVEARRTRSRLRERTRKVDLRTNFILGGGSEEP